MTTGDGEDLTATWWLNAVDGVVHRVDEVSLRKDGGNLTLTIPGVGKSVSGRRVETSPEKGNVACSHTSY